MKKNIALDKTSVAMNKLTIAMIETSQSLSLFYEEIKAFKNRYHPIVYWMFEIGLLK